MALKGITFFAFFWIISQIPLQKSSASPTCKHFELPDRLSPSGYCKETPQEVRHFCYQYGNAPKTTVGNGSVNFSAFVPWLNSSRPKCSLALRRMLCAEFGRPCKIHPCWWCVNEAKVRESWELFPLKLCEEVHLNCPQEILQYGMFSFLDLDCELRSWPSCFSVVEQVNVTDYKEMLFYGTQQIHENDNQEPLESTMNSSSFQPYGNWTSLLLPFLLMCLFLAIQISHRNQFEPLPPEHFWPTFIATVFLLITMLSGFITSKTFGQFPPAKFDNFWLCPLAAFFIEFLAIYGICQALLQLLELLFSRMAKPRRIGRKVWIQQFLLWEWFPPCYSFAMAGISAFFSEASSLGSKFGECRFGCDGFSREFIILALCCWLFFAAIAILFELSLRKHSDDGYGYGTLLLVPVALFVPAMISLMGQEREFQEQVHSAFSLLMQLLLPVAIPVFVSATLMFLSAKSKPTKRNIPITAI